MRSVRAAGESRIGMEISPNDRKPFHEDAAIAPSRDRRYYKLFAGPDNTPNCQVPHGERRTKGEFVGGARNSKINSHKVQSGPCARPAARPARLLFSSGLGRPRFMKNRSGIPRLSLVLAS